MELKSCPFCGGEYTQVRYIGWESPSAFDSGYRAECCDCGVITAAYPTEAGAIAAWNTRHVETCRITSKGEPEYDVITRDYEFSCGHTIAWGHVYEPNYCPNCGRKVEG